MRKIFSILLLICITVALVASDTIQIPNKEYLTSRKFETSSGFYGSNLKFFSNNNYTIGFGIEGDNYWYNEGKYEIINGQVWLYPNKCLEHENGPVKNCDKTIGEATCFLERDNESLYYSIMLNCKSKNYKRVIVDNTDSIAYPILDSKVKPGEKKIINTIEVVSMGMATATTTTKVKIRTHPSINSKEATYFEQLFGNSTTSIVPEKTQILVYARTVKKDKIQNWENYWYYIKVGITDGVWMFGEFIKFEKN